MVKHKHDKKSRIISTKKRLILDAKRSRANDLAAARQRLLLPRPFHAVDNILKLMRSCRARLRRMAAQAGVSTSVLVELLVADFIDAYWAVPVHPAERRYQVAKWKGMWLVFLRTCQGTNNGGVDR